MCIKLHQPTGIEDIKVTEAIGKEIIEINRNEVYSGCYARVSINFYAFNTNGNRGIACGLRNIQKIRDGKPLGGHTSANNDFTSININSDDYFLD